MKLTVTAATGQLGTHVVKEALRHFPKEEIRLAVRTPKTKQRRTPLPAWML